MQGQVEDGVIVRPLALAGGSPLSTRYQEMLGWIGEIEMPRESVGLREAGGNIGGLLVSLMTTGRAEFVQAEAANIAELCDLLSGKVTCADAGTILAAIGEGARHALSSGNVVIEFR